MRRPSPIPILVAVVVLVILEGGVRLAAPRIAEPLIWNDHEVQNKVARLDALQRVKASVVFAGSSSMNAAVDPRLAARLVESQDAAFNAALNGADLRSMHFWLNNIVLGRVRPRVVVVGTTSLELNDNGLTQQDFYRKLIRSEGARRATGRLGSVGRLESWLENHSYLARYRTELRRPSRLLKGDPRARDAGVDPWGVLQAIPTFQRRPYGVPGEFRRRTRTESFHDYAVGGAQLQTLGRLSTELASAGVELVVVKMPVTSSVFAENKVVG